MFSLGHLSDLHATPLRLAGPRDLLNKRLLGWLSWWVKRRRAHRPRVLEALLADLSQDLPHHVVVTGDLTNVALESEFAAARRWLERMGPPDRVSVVPGNHDAYVAMPWSASFRHWADYMASDACAAPADSAVEFPSLRVRGPLALLGLSSAQATAPFLASGALGEAQLGRLERQLAELAGSQLFRVVLLHHPPTPDAVSPRRALRDGERLRAVLSRHGADLVLHGHSHRTLVGSLPGPDGAIPVVGVRSSSDVGSRPGRRAQYHVYDVTPEAHALGRPSFRIQLRVRGFDPSSLRFAAEGERAL